MRACLVLCYVVGCVQIGVAMDSKVMWFMFGLIIGAILNDAVDVGFTVGMFCR